MATTLTKAGPGAPARTTDRRTTLRRWWRRRPINRFLVLSHRWPALILGLFLVVETTSGAILLYHSEIFRATNGNLYHHTASANPITPDRAIDIVDQAHPKFGAIWVAKDDGVYVVGEASYKDQYFVDPGTGKINGLGSTDNGFMGLLVNIHDCGFTCENYPGYSSWAATPIWQDGPTMFRDITRGGFAVGITGLLMILLVLSSFKIWWPGIKRLKSRFVVRRGKTRFARDYDLHNVIGAISLPLVLMWAITGAAFEFPVVEKAWLAITAGDQPPKAEEAFFIEPNKVAKGTPDIGVDKAVDVALDAVPGSTVSFIGRPTKAFDNYEIDVIHTGAYEHRAIYSGDTYVLIDPRDATNFKVIGADERTASNRFYDKVLEPTHFGWNVNGWWRIIWFVLGIAPLLLMLTGISTWLYRRGIKKRRKQAGQKKLSDAQLDPDHLDRDGELDSAAVDPGDDHEATVDDADLQPDEHGDLHPTNTA